MLEDSLAGLVRQVEPRLLVPLLEEVDDADRLVVVLERADAGDGLRRERHGRLAARQDPVQRLLPRVAERGVPEVVGEGARLGEILVQAERPRDRPRHLRHLEGVRQARPVEEFIFKYYLSILLSNEN